MKRPTTRSLLITGALLLATVAGTAAVSAATVAPGAAVPALAGHHPARNRRVRLVYTRGTVASVSATGGSLYTTGGSPLATGELVVRTRAGKTIAVNIDNLTRAYVARGPNAGGPCRIDPTTLAPGDLVVVRSEVINVKPTARLAILIAYTSANPLTTTPPACLPPTPASATATNA